MDNKKITCVGLGEIIWDMLPSGDRLGGAPANFTYHALQAGLDARIVSAVGKDERGVEAKRLLEASGVHGLIFDTDYVTGFVKVVLDEDGVATYDFAEDASYDHMPVTKELLDLASKTDICCFGTLAQRWGEKETRSTVMAFLEAMPEESVRVCDINLRCNFYSPETIVGSLEHASVLKCNEEEVPCIADCLGLHNPEITAAELLNHIENVFGISKLIYTCGAEGSEIFWDGEHSYIETPKVEVVDTVGAGDSFTATFIALVRQGVALKDAHAMAVKVAASVCAHAGAMVPLTPELKSEMEALLASVKA